MGVDFADYDNDGRPDIVVTDLSNERYMLFRQNADGSFRDVTNSTGVGGATLPFSGWSTRFFDYDNDGWKDLFVAQGHVMDTIEKTAPNLKYLQPPLLLRNESATLRESGCRAKSFNRNGPVAAPRSAIWTTMATSTSSSATSARAPSCCGTTAATGRNWLQIRTVGTTSNRDGIGCRVKVVSASGLTQYFTVTTAVGYLSASDKRLIVGLGGDAAATLVEIRWPSGVVQTFENVKAGQTLTATEPAADDATRRDVDSRAARRSRRGRSVRAGRLLARCQAAASRQALRPSVPSRASPTSRSRRASPSRSSMAARTSKSYIIEVVGCGVAFFDYDNDGWLDLLRAERHAPRRRAAGRDQSPVQEQP